MSAQQDSAPESGGKGSFPRIWNTDKFRDNFDGIDWGREKEKCPVCDGDEPCSHDFDRVEPLFLGTGMCRRCGAALKPGIATKQTWVCGTPDFPGNDKNSPGQTLTCGGPGEMMKCSKCPECGHSVT